MPAVLLGTRIPQVGRMLLVFVITSSATCTSRASTIATMGLRGRSGTTSSMSTNDCSPLRADVGFLEPSSECSAKQNKT
eukprot:77069-Lingulodinium_polyedra.AAC.1